MDVAETHATLFQGTWSLATPESPWFVTIRLLRGTQPLRGGVLVS